MIRFVAFLLAGIGSLMASPTAVSGDDHPLEAVVSIPPQQGILERLGGSEVFVTVLIPPGRSPATFEPGPRQLTAILRSDLLLPLGLPFERTVTARIEKMAPGLEVCRAAASDFDAVVHGQRSSMDPHFWLDPVLATEYARNVVRCLDRLRPDSAPLFETNLEAFAGELGELDRRITRRLEPYKGRRFYVFHPAFGYFARRYGLEQIAIEHEGKNPTGRQLADVIEHARTDGVRTIFVQPQFADSSAQAVASAIGATIVPLDPLPRDVVTGIERIADAVVQALESPEEEER